jgi:long-chain acyl-CoA synthetase
VHREQPAVPFLAAASGPAGAWSNLVDLVAARAAERPDVVALVEPTAPRRELTWAELDARVSAVATGLASRGLRAGHRLALLGPGSAAWITAYLATLRAGVVAVPLNPQAAPDELAAMVADSGARLLLGATEAALPGVETLPLTDAGLDALATEPVLVSSPRDAESLAVLLYTAGSSGRAKAAMLTHRALLAHVEQVGRLGVLQAEDVVLAILPLFHVFGLNAVLGGWLGSGARLVVTDGYPDGICELIRDEGVTNLALAPPTLQRLLAEPDLDAGLGGLRTVVSGAAPLPESLAEAFQARTGLRVERGYGLTEAAPGVTTTLGGGSDGPGHVGRPLPGVEVRIGDGDGIEPDEIFVRGPNLFSGYWPDGRDGPDADGWFATGDIGYLDSDELVLVDRSRELVVVSGFHVYPAEVEHVIAELDGVQDVAVIGQADARTGEQVVAFVQGAGVTAAQVKAHCEQRLARFKRPAYVHVLDELPRGAMGKIKKGMLREMTRAEQDPA